MRELQSCYPDSHLSLARLWGRVGHGQAVVWMLVPFERVFCFLQKVPEWLIF